jgi:F-type H+-transporting ATPase subunit c
LLSLQPVNLIGELIHGSSSGKTYRLGIIFGNFLSGALRNPSAAPGQFPNLLLGFALAEATGLFGLVIALILLFVF